MTPHTSTSGKSMSEFQAMKEDLDSAILDSLVSAQRCVRKGLATKQIPLAPNPCIIVDRTALIGLPLSARLGSDIITWWQSHPMCASSSTKAYSAIPATSMHLANTHWDDWILKEATALMDSLGAPGLRKICQLQSLSLCTEGTTPFVGNPEAGAYAYMIVALPCQAEGFSVTVQLNGRQESIACSGEGYSTTLIAWPADAGFTFKSITSGCQPMLIYRIYAQAGPTFKKWQARQWIPFSPDRSDSEAEIAQAIKQWQSIAATSSDTPRSLVFVTNTHCETIESHAAQSFQPFEESSDELSFVDFLQKLGHTAGFEVSLGHVVIRLTGRASTDTPPVWNYARDEHDWDSFGEHDEDVWLDEENIKHSWTTWAFTPVLSHDGLLDKAHQRKLSSTEVLNIDWIPDEDELREPDRSDYGGWEEERYGGYCGYINTEYDRAAVCITLL